MTWSNKMTFVVPHMHTFRVWFATHKISKTLRSSLKILINILICIWTILNWHNYLFVLGVFLHFVMSLQNIYIICKFIPSFKEMFIYLSWSGLALVLNLMYKCKHPIYWLVFIIPIKISENNHKVSLDILSSQILLNFNNQLEDLLWIY